ncbi:MAG: hypothetical protein HRU41_26560 [Saprospiraceae bacterium]|nr:hypothetical protein [Saprospiraceae bacterium]
MKINHLTAVGLCLCIFFAACKKDDDNTAMCDIEIPAGTRFFEFQNDGGDTFYAWTNKADIIAAVEAQLSLPLEQRSQHINGKIARIEGDCSLNQEWSWYFLADEWLLADASIEVCDGNPQYVEENLDDYLAIERYCPWGSVVVKEVTQPF